MPTKPKLPPGVSIKEHKDGNASIWRARLGKKFTGQAPERKGFRSYKEAFDWLTGKIAERSKTREEVADKAAKLDLSPKHIAEAIVAISKLGGKTTLIEAAEMWLDQNARRQSPPIGTAIEMLIAEKRNSGKGEKHISDLKNSLQRLFRGMEKAPIATITDELFDKVLTATQTSLADRRNKRRDALILFRFARAKRLVEINPVESVTKPTVPVEAVQVLSPLQTAQLLVKAQEIAPEMLGYFIITIFAGLRNPEVMMLRWVDVDMSGKEIHVQSGYSKTRRARQVTIHPTLAAWITVLNLHGAETDFVCPVKPGTSKPEKFDLQRRRKAVSDATGITPWPENCLRHGFGSYHFALRKNAALTSAEMGNSEQVVKASYTKAVKKRDRQRFWSLDPATAEAATKGMWDSEEVGWLPEEDPPTLEDDVEPERVIGVPLPPGSGDVSTSWPSTRQGSP